MSDLVTLLTGVGLSLPLRNSARRQYVGSSRTTDYSLTTFMSTALLAAIVAAGSYGRTRVTAARYYGTCALTTWNDDNLIVEGS
jgi:hypothetical protein